MRFKVGGKLRGSGCTSVLRLLEYAASTVAVGVSASRSKLPTVKLASSPHRKLVDAATEYSAARSRPDIPPRVSPVRGASIKRRSSSGSSARRLRFTSIRAFIGCKCDRGDADVRRLRTAHLQNAPAAAR
jgi:hypothetical protein